MRVVWGLGCEEVRKLKPTPNSEALTKKAVSQHPEAKSNGEMLKRDIGYC